MVLIIDTKSHGEIRSGFSGFQNNFVLLGDYMFSSRGFCELVAKMAKSKDIHEFSIQGHPSWELDAEVESNMKRALAKHFNIGTSAVRMSERIMEFDASNPSNVRVRKSKAAQEQNEVDFKKLRVNVRTGEKNSEIKFGKYRISGNDFTILAYQVASGGFAGWDRKTPMFASDAMKAMESSDNRLFQLVRKQGKKKRRA